MVLSGEDQVIYQGVGLQKKYSVIQSDNTVAESVILTFVMLVL